MCDYKYTTMANKIWTRIKLYHNVILIASCISCVKLLLLPSKNLISLREEEVDGHRLVIHQYRMWIRFQLIMTSESAHKGILRKYLLLNTSDHFLLQSFLGMIYDNENNTDGMPQVLTTLQQLPLPWKEC